MSISDDTPTSYRIPNNESLGLSSNPKRSPKDGETKAAP